ncbi:hypothetical protein D3C73_1314560 [compost metagenome]
MNTKRSPPVISKMAVDPASPRYQLHEGLYSSQNTETGSASSRKRAISNWWMAMSSRSGWSMASRKPPKCGALKNSADTMPTAPKVDDRCLAENKCLLYRRDWLTMNS